MSRTRAHVGEAEFLQELADIALVIINAETFLDDLLKVDPPPAHHAVNGTVRALLHENCQFHLLLGRQSR